MSDPSSNPDFIQAASAPARARIPGETEPFASRTGERVKRPLGDPFGLKAFGVNLSTLASGAVSTLHRGHSRRDEFVYVVEGELVLHVGGRTTVLRAGDCVGFPAGGEPHHLENRSDRPANYLEVGDRPPGDSTASARDGSGADMGPDGSWRFAARATRSSEPE